MEKDNSHKKKNNKKTTQGCSVSKDVTFHLNQCREWNRWETEAQGHEITAQNQVDVVCQKIQALKSRNSPPVTWHLMKLKQVVFGVTGQVYWLHGLVWQKRSEPV